MLSSFQYLLCQQSVGDTTVGMAVGTSNVNDAEDQHREGPAHPEGARPQGQLPPLPSPSFPLCRKPISVWSEDYVWTLLTGDAQPCNQFGVNLGAGSSRMSTNVASSTEQSFEHVCQSRPTTSCSTMVTGEYTTTTTSSEPHVTRSFLCTAENMLSAPPSQRPPMLVPDTCALTTCSPHPAAFSSGTATTSGVCPPSHSSICTSSQSLSSPSVIDLTATEDDDGGPDDNDFDRLFADVDMAQFEESCLASQSTDSSETTVLKQDSKVQSLSSRRGQSCSVSNVQSGSRVEMYSDSGGGGVGSGRVALQTDAPSDSRSGKKAGISHRVEEKSSVSSCPVCAVAFQPRYIWWACTYCMTFVKLLFACKNGSTCHSYCIAWHCLSEVDILRHKMKHADTILL